MIDRKLLNKLVDTVVWRLIFWLGAILIAQMAINYANSYFQIGWDDSDAQAPSGLKIYTDSRTNCQYLSSQSGGLTPRLDRTGIQICE